MYTLKKPVRYLVSDRDFIAKNLLHIIVNSLVTITISTALLSCILVFPGCHNTTYIQKSPVSLIVFITIDQLRGDLLLRYADRFCESGFQRILKNGTYYTNAYFDHTPTQTAVGHAVLHTGADIRDHGIAANEWRDPFTGRFIYAVEDTGETIPGEPINIHSGTSPRNLCAETLSDVIYKSWPKSRSFAVSLKDRAAIIPAGKSGKAFWHSSHTGRFVTSTYYYTEWPAWLSNWNHEGLNNEYADSSWRLLLQRHQYDHADVDDRPYEIDYYGMGRIFPHKLTGSKPEDVYRVIRYTPYGDYLTMCFVKELMKNEKVGQGDTPDMLSISFSSTDYIQHVFGPNSLESEDNLLRLDRTLSELLAFIDETVGLNKTIVILTADHGVDAIPEYRQTVPKRGKTEEEGWDLDPALSKYHEKPTEIENKVSAGRHFPERFISEVNTALRNETGTDEDIVVDFLPPYLYLDTITLSRNGIDFPRAERIAADVLEQFPGIAHAIPRSDLLNETFAQSHLLHRVWKSFHPERSGHVYVLPSPYWFMSDKPLKYAAMHGSPWEYDLHVPIVLSAHGNKASRVSRKVNPCSIVPTLCSWLSVRPPDKSTSELLHEFLD